MPFGMYLYEYQFRCTTVWGKHGCMDNMLSLCFDLCYLLFLAFDFCRFCVVIVCFHPRHNGQLPPTAKDSNLTIQGNYWYHCYILLVWRGPWLVIEPGTSLTKIQHSTVKTEKIEAWMHYHHNHQYIYTSTFCILPSRVYDLQLY